MQDNGQKKNSNFMDYECEICKGTGYEWYEVDGKSFARDCSCGLRKRLAMKNKLQFAQLPDIYKDVDLENFKTDIYELEESKKIMETNMKVTEYWLNHFSEMQADGMGLYIHSQTKGSGKTRFAASLANNLMMNEKVSVKFSTSVQIIDEIKASWDKDYEVSEHQLLKDLSKAEVLIIDDFGIEDPKPWIMERFYQVVNNRYLSKHITIFTSNMDIDSLRYDDRIKNRIKERVFALRFPEESIREQIYKKHMTELARALGKEA